MIVKIEGVQIAYYEGTYFGVCGEEFIVTNKVSLLSTYAMYSLPAIPIEEFVKAENNPATMAEIQSMGFTFGLHYPLKGGKR